jgi:SET domain-containing protein
MPKRKNITYKNRRYLRKTIRRKQRGGSNIDLHFDASKIHPASIIFDKKFTIKKSSIHGVGVFAKKNIEINEVIHCAIHMLKQPNKEGHLFKITDDFGKYINHSTLNANTELMKLSDGDYHLTAIKYIPKDTEILVDYDGKNIPSFIHGSKPHYKP